MAIDIQNITDSVVDKSGGLGVNSLGQTTGAYQTPEYLIFRGFVLLEWAVGIGAFIVILIGAINYITAGGDAEKAEKGKKMIIGSIIGIIIFTSAYLIYSTTIKLMSGRNTDSTTMQEILDENANEGITNSISDPKNNAQGGSTGNLPTSNNGN